MTQNPITRINPNAAGDMRTVELFGNPLALAEDLLALDGPQFMSYDAVYPEDALRMLKKHRVLKSDNPFIGSGICKIAKTQVTVNFDYERKRESRGGEEPETHGTWHTAVIVNGKVSPLCVHKEDVFTELPEGQKDKLANRRAILGDDGNVVFTTSRPRLYLRYEIVRVGEQDDRNDRKMRSVSKYMLPTGVEVVDILEDGSEKRHVDEVVEQYLLPYLPKRDSRKDQTDFQTTALQHVVELRAAGKIYRRHE